MAKQFIARFPPQKRGQMLKDNGMRAFDAQEYKLSAGAVREHADRTVLFDGRGLDLDLGDLGLIDGRWTLRR